MRTTNNQSSTATPSADAEIDAYVTKATSGNLADVPAFSAFQRQIDKYPQLSPEAQHEMLERVRAGRAAQQIRQADLPPLAR